MMCKKWRTTGLNRILAGLLALCLLVAGLPAMAETADDTQYAVSVEGFTLDFDVNTDYYLAYPQDFDNCKIMGYEGFQDLTVSVEQYATYYPYKTTDYVLGEPLKLGNGRAKLTLTATLTNNTTKEYLIVLTDPDAADYAYARARVSGTVNMRKEPNTNSEVLTTFYNNARVYYLKTVGDWCLVEGLYYGQVGYIHKNYLRWGWLTTEMPAEYKTAIEALQANHPNWTFEFVDVEMTYEEALAKYGAANAQYIDPLHYLNEEYIFAMLNIDVYDQETWNDEGIKAIWVREDAITKDDAVRYFNAASSSLLMNPYYIACRAALESGYGTSKYAKGMSTVSEVKAESNITVNGKSLVKGEKYQNLELGGTYYNLYGIGAYDNNPNWCMVTAANRNWNSLFRSIVEGANWVKDQYLDQGAVTPYFFRFAGFQNKNYMSDVKAPQKEAAILKRAFTDPNAKAHFTVPVYRGYGEQEIDVTRYTDLDTNEWYYPEVTAAIKAGLFEGQSPTYFNVDGEITRAEFVTALARLCGVDVTSYKSEGLNDVKPGDWFYEEVGWAYAAGITNGKSPVTFCPDAPITREEMCKLLGGTIEKVLGVKLSTEGAVTFPDQSKISDWATEWVAKCSANKIFEGENGYFNPANNATRAQATAVIYRCHNTLN